MVVIYLSAFMQVLSKLVNYKYVFHKVEVKLPQLGRKLLHLVFWTVINVTTKWYFGDNPRPFPAHFCD